MSAVGNQRRDTQDDLSSRPELIDYMLFSNQGKDLLFYYLAPIIS